MTPREETENREPRPEKVKAVGDLAERLKESAGLLLTDYRGMSVKAMGELRSALRAQGAAYQVVKNNLLRRAAEKAGCGDVVEWLEGPIAMVFLGEEIVGQTKILVDFAKENENLPVIKGGFVEGRKLAAASVRELAQLPPREILLAMLVGTLQSPMSQLLATMQAPMMLLAATLEGLSKQKAASA